MLIRHIDSDATGPVILDTGILKANYDKELRRKGFDFTTSWTSNTGQKELKVPAVFPEYKSALMIGGYKKHLFLQLLPEAFFAVLLLSVISGAFIVMYRSFRTQQKLGIMKNDLVSNMTHELKTPIATVKVALEALNSFGMINDPRTSKEYLGMAVAEMDRLELLVSQALNTSLLESGTMQLSMERQDITPVIRQTIAAMQPKLEQNGALLELSLPDGPVTGDIDRLHFQGVIVNLVDNSLKYADKQPVIRITLQHEGQWIRITVSDNGPGIPDRYIDKVFDKFFRVPSGNVHNVSGYGLGLSYSKKTVEQHGGALGVRNNEEGGCSFIILLRKP
jgi:signal transduction histidine kinase